MAEQVRQDTWAGYTVFAWAAQQQLQEHQARWAIGRARVVYVLQ